MNFILSDSGDDSTTQLVGLGCSPKTSFFLAQEFQYQHLA